MSRDTRWRNCQRCKEWKFCTFNRRVEQMLCRECYQREIDDD